MDGDVGDAFVEESKNRAAKGRDMINHCLDQLQDGDIWWVPAEGCNCIGVIIQHLLGNLRQWIVSGVGGAEDVRDRPREFRVEERTPKSTVQRRLNDMVDHVIETYAGMDTSLLLEQRRIQGSDRSVLGAIYGTMGHLELHAGQIFYITRLKMGKAYKERRRPANKERGA